MCICRIIDSNGILQEYQIDINKKMSIRKIKEFFLSKGFISEDHTAIMNYDRADLDLVPSTNEEISFVLPVKMTGTEWRLSRTIKRKNKKDTE